MPLDNANSKDTQLGPEGMVLDGIVDEHRESFYGAFREQGA